MYARKTNTWIGIKAGMIVCNLLATPMLKLSKLKYLTRFEIVGIVILTNPKNQWMTRRNLSPSQIPINLKHRD